MVCSSSRQKARMNSLTSWRQTGEKTSERKILVEKNILLTEKVIWQNSNVLIPLSKPNAKSANLIRSLQKQKRSIWSAVFRGWGQQPFRTIEILRQRDQVSSGFGLSWLLLSLLNIPLRLTMAIQVTSNFHNNTGKFSIPPLSNMECSRQSGFMH